MSNVFNLSRATLFGFALVMGTTLLVACGDRQSMAAKSEQAFEDAQKKGLPIDKGGHGGHENMDMSGSKQGDMKGVDMSGMEMSPIAGARA